MSDFSITIKEKINEFKSTYRRELPQHIKEDLDIESLEIKRREIKNYSDVSLYHKTRELIKTLETKQKDEKNALFEHQGIEKFILQIKEIMDHYAYYENNIIHKNQFSCESLIRAIQIVTLNKTPLNYQCLTKLKQCCKVIFELNNSIHIEKLLFAIKANYKTNPAFFDKVLNYCNQLRK